MNKRILGIFFACLMAGSQNAAGFSSGLSALYEEAKFTVYAVGASCLTNYMAQKSTEYHGGASLLITLGMLGWAAETTHLLTKHTKDTSTRHERTACLVVGHVIAIAFGLGLGGASGGGENSDGYIIDNMGMLRRNKVQISGDLTGTAVQWLSGK